MEHYLPVRAGGNLPTEIPGALVGMADRLDTISGCFGIGQVPTGTTDPFGVRRLALGLLHIMESQGFALSLPEVDEAALQLYDDKLTEDFGVDPEYPKGTIANGTAASVPLVISMINSD